MRHIHQGLPAEEQKEVNRLLNRVLIIYAVLITVMVGAAALKMPDTGFAEARAANAIPTQPPQ